jgi:hypothetical protein
MSEETEMDTYTIIAIIALAIIALIVIIKFMKGPSNTEKYENTKDETPMIDDSENVSIYDENLDDDDVKYPESDVDSDEDTY